ncbi:biliverdin-producing heme oxygenase [Mangrovihabitans endophyticus]|uniref:Biliverdin-producing heme oxygenase n=1 Tax=Mangrovihabitans endophyticus TaxID=1751298 RepID=A0A8J3BZH4_9ACTN|nr:biliverdin-producing heme oxygenase [Mangrovihabitans endophyticus]GGK96322.1 biliverdin-producing heme oxygenase [Mangrovihabitans endophyticus]
MALTADSPLSARVRADTRTDHDAAQRSGFLDALAAGRLPRAAYTDLAAQHWHIYRALEQAAARMAADPVAGRFVAAELTRVPALTADLHFLAGRRWHRRLAALPATLAYRRRLHEVAAVHPPSFVAHHYTRYMGDLSGGQYLGPVIARAYGLDGDGHRFFVFDGVDPAAFRAGYRRLLDAAPWGGAEQDTFLDEVAVAYRLTIDVLDELRERWE